MPIQLVREIEISLHDGCEPCRSCFYRFVSALIPQRPHLFQIRLQTEGRRNAGRISWKRCTKRRVDAPSLMKVGGFHIANESTEGVATSTLADVEDVCWHLPLGKVRSTLLALVTNTNAMNYLVQSARPSVKII